MWRVHMNICNIHIFLVEWQVSVSSEELKQAERFCLANKSIFKNFCGLLLMHHSVHFKPVFHDQKSI